MTEGSILLTYATQQGNAKAIAEDLHETISNKLVDHPCKLLCVSEIGKSIELHNITCLVLIGATTGDGDPPDTAKKFWRYLHNKCKQENNLGTLLSKLYYTVLGLGDTNYTNFCNFGKTVDKKFNSLGAQRFYNCDWADDGTGLEVVVEPWLENLIPALLKHLKLSNYQESLSIKNCNNLVLNNKTTEEMASINVDDISILEMNSSNQSESKGEISNDFILENQWHKFQQLKCVRNLCLQVDALKDFEVRKLAFSNESKLTIPAMLPSYLNINYTNESHDLIKSEQIQNGFPLPSAGSDLCSAQIVNCRTLTKDGSVKKTLDISLKVSSSEEVLYEPGDSFGIICQNVKDEVDCLLELLNVMDLSDKVYKLSIDSNTKKKNPSIPAYIPPLSTLRHVFTSCLDIRTIPKKTFLRALCEWTLDSKEKRRLQELVSREGAAEYNDKIRASGVTVLDLLILFQSCKPPVTLLLEHCPRLLPRPYSITSSPLNNNDQISFAFNVVEINKSNSLTFNRKGICTGWLEEITSIKSNTGEEDCIKELKDLTLKDVNCELSIYFRNNKNFRLSKNLNTPIIMVGPGTGVAPFLGFLEHRKLLYKKFNKEIGESWLFYGCRNKELDFLYESELNNYLTAGVLGKLCVCYSRDETDISEKYVQDNIRKHGAEVAKLISEENAIVYVCGDATHMARNVYDAFLEVIQNYKELSDLDARKFMADLQTNQQYLQDVWT